MLSFSFVVLFVYAYANVTSVNPPLRHALLNNQTSGVCKLARTYCAPLLVAPYLRVLTYLYI